MTTTVFLRKKLLSTMLAAVLLLLLASPPSAAAAETVAAVQGNDGVRILFNDDRTFKGNSASQDAYFEVGQGLVSAAGSYIDLFISHSNTLLSELSSLTVLVDDVPVDSIQLTTENANRTEWRVGLPDANLKAGYHKITLAAKLRSNNLICEDPDNPSSWLVVMSSSRIKLKLVPNGEPANLGNYPGPFVARGEADPIKAVLIVPDTPSKAEFAAAARLSQYLAAQTSSGRLLVPIFTESDAGEDLLASNNAIWIGGESRWKGAGVKLMTEGADAVARSSAQDSVGTDFISLTPSSWNPVLLQLVVSGSGDSLIRAADILTHSALYRQLQGTSMPIPSTVEDSLQQAPETGNPYEVSLADIGYNNLTVQNTAQGSVTVVYPIPGGWDLTDGATLRLKFTHSEAIAFHHSKATIRLNGTPVYSVELTKDTAKNGFLEVPLNPSVIGTSRSLAIEIAFQFAERADGTNSTSTSSVVSCGTSGPLGSWARIDPASTISYTPATRHTAYLQSLPFPYVVGGAWQPTTFVLERADTASLQLAMTLIGALGTGNPDTQNIDLVTTDVADWADQLQDRHVVYIGTTASMPIKLRDYAGSYAKFEETVVTAKSGAVQLLPAIQRDAAYMQLTTSPLGIDTDRRLLVLTATSTKRLSLLSTALVGDAEGDGLSGRFVAIDSQGKLYAFPDTQDAEASYEIKPSKQSRWSVSGVSVPMFGLAFVAIMVLAFLALWFNRRKQD
ncbi:cellulose biosynthesis cyclic di-GMP-binding regulatory protein BcsB [Cohnella sp. GCM10020058]|uniref:cellulose biosynthesis cyclic di-GMP-binding regulatory protein BcsB n=1 Tax=Cohnella sp. GCM10020058 TaxID=3317330 RepID=UPI003636C34B